MNAKHIGQLRALGGEQSARIKEAKQMVTEQRNRRYQSGREDFTIDRNTLMSKQVYEKQDLQQRWGQRNKQRQASISALKTKGRIAPRDEALLSQGEKITAKQQLKEQRERQRKGRSRSRTRKHEE